LSPGSRDSLQAVEKGFRCPRIAGKLALKSLLMDIERRDLSPYGIFDAFSTTCQGSG
jgi:hypothetical protein